MDLYCTRPGCPKPVNPFVDLDDPAILKSVPQKYCTRCGMPLILIGRYLPLKLLGRGGFGAAFLARDRYTPKLRQCVVKQFQPASHFTPSQLQVAQELFEREAQALEDLGNAHPAIPDLYAFFELTVPSYPPGQQVKFFYLVQEFIDGETLETELAKQGPFSPQDVTIVLQEVLAILQFVHDHGSIHRDIKPSNIMRNPEGRIYLLDFGAVRQAAKVNVKSTGIFSEGFAPPEQMRGGEIYPSSDLYALAVTALVLLTGRLPDELYDARNDVWQWRAYAPQVSNSLAQVLNRMLNSSPSQRFQSASEVLAALTPQASSPASLTSPPSPSPISSSPVPNPQPPIPNPQPSSRPSLSLPPSIAPFSTLELLANAGFTGFTGGIIGIALASLLGTTLISGGFWLLLLLGLVVLQSRRIIERVDLLIIMGVSLALVLLVAPLRQIIALPIAGSPLLTVVMIATFLGLAAILITIVFRLVYLLLSRIL
jgi:serine/threonine-protein kinase